MTDIATTRTIPEVQSDLAAAKLAHQAAKTALDAASRVEEAARNAVSGLIAEGRSLIDGAKAEFEAAEGYLTGKIEGVEADLKAVL